MAERGHGRGRPAGRAPQPSPPLRIAGIGLLLVAATMGFLALAAPGSVPREVTPDIPIGAIPTTGDNWTAVGNPSEVRILHLGSDAGYVRAGWETPFCAQVVDGRGDDLEGAEVTFSAAEGTITPDSVSTGIDGTACATFLAPSTPGGVVVTVRASKAGLGSDEATKTVEVVGGASVDPWALPAGVAVVAFTAGTSLLLIAPSGDSAAAGPKGWRGRLLLGSLWLVLGAALLLATASPTLPPEESGLAEESHGAEAGVPRPSPFTLPAVGVGVVGSLLVASGFRQATGNHRAPWLRRAKLAALTLVLADGAIHLYASADHSGIPAFVAFLFATGLAQVMLPPLAVRRTTLFAWFGIGISATLIALFAYTRVFPPPFHDDPEPVEALGLVSKALEVATIAVLGSVLMRARFSRLQSGARRLRFRKAGTLPGAPKPRAEGD